MVHYQTDGIKTKVLIGSAEIEIGDGPDDAVSLGIITGNIEVKLEETPLSFVPSNAPKQLYGMSEQEATIAVTVWDCDLRNVENLRRGLDYLEIIDGGNVDVTGEQHTAALGGFFPLKYRNLDGTPVSGISVFTDTGTLITAAGNYRIAMDPRGGTNIFVLDDADDIEQNQVLKVDYTYASAAGVKWGTGGMSKMAYRYLRMTNTDSAGKIFRMEFWKCVFDGGLSLSLKPDNSTDPNDIPVTLRAVVDTTKPAGIQLVQITDMQGVIAG